MRRREEIRTFVAPAPSFLLLRTSVFATIRDTQQKLKKETRYSKFIVSYFPLERDKGLGCDPRVKVKH